MSATVVDPVPKLVAHGLPALRGWPGPSPQCSVVGFGRSRPCSPGEFVVSRVAAVLFSQDASSSAWGSVDTCPQVDQRARVVAGADLTQPDGAGAVLPVDEPGSRAAVVEVLRWLQSTGADYLLWMLSPRPNVTERGLGRLLDTARETGAALVYSDYLQQEADGAFRLRPLVQYQPGSIRDDFDFGQMVLLDASRLARLIDEVQRSHAGTRFGGWYDLRLRLSEAGPVVHLPEPTYTVAAVQQAEGEADHFKYVDPRNRDYQIEMEQVATEHLRRIGAFLEPPTAPRATVAESFPVEASVVIPVRNRERTVADAVKSALGQATEFAFNVVVVDNHSTDRTTEILAEIAENDSRLVHVVPERTDLGIGGCWNEAIDSEHCGRFAVQLDSDDLYAADNVLQRIVDVFLTTDCAMVVGSYEVVDFQLQPLPPGLIDHREWTDDNGHNNALRINGLGAPRAFDTATVRRFGFPNVSYGEDYAVALKICSRHRVGRIYDSLYLCRRWEDNTDHTLPQETINRYALYKDRIRSIEIAARKNRKR